MSVPEKMFFQFVCRGGESPFTHPQIKEMVRYATRSIKNVSLLTNAFYLNNDIIDCFIREKLSYVSVSFDGIGKIYESIRYPAKFETSYGALKLLQQKKARAGSPFPQVRVCTVWPAIKDDPGAYTEAMQQVADYIVCNPYINFTGDMKIKPDFICQYPWERIVIGFNGNTQCCTGWNATDIVLGNIRHQSIQTMWQSQLMQNVRSIHDSGKRLELESCAACRHGAAGDSEADIWKIVERRY